MVRRIDTIEPAARYQPSSLHIADTYVRPAKNEDLSLEDTARAVSGFNAKILPLLDTKQEEKDNFDIGRGIALFNIIGVDNLPWEDVLTKIANGEIEGIKEITAKVRDGYITEQHKAAGLKYISAMNDWESKGVGIDDNGNEVNLSSVESPDALLAMYEREQSRVLKSYIGGGYDPILYAKHIQPMVDAKTQDFLNNQSQERGKVLYDQRIRAFGETMNAFMNSNIQDSEFVIDDDKFTPEYMATVINKEIAEAVQSGIRQDDAYKQVTKMFRSMMYDYDVDNIDGLKEVAKLLPLWNDPEQRGIIEAASKNAVEDRRRSDSNKRAVQMQEKKDAMGDAFTKMLEAHNYDPSAIPRAEWTQIAKIAPELYGYVADLQGAFYTVNDRASNRQYSISDDEFYRAYGDLASGRRGLGSLIGFAGKASPEQLRELAGGFNLYKSEVQAGIRASNSSASTAAKVSKQNLGTFNKLKAKALKMLTAGDKAMDYADSVLYDDMARRIAYESIRRGQAWKQKNPKSDAIEYEDAVGGFLNNAVLNYGKNKDYYREHRDALSADVSAVTKTRAVEEARDKIGRLPKGSKVISSTLSRIESGMKRGDANIQFTPSEVKALGKELKKTDYAGNGEQFVKDMVKLYREIQ